MHRESNDQYMYVTSYCVSEAGEDTHTYPIICEQSKREEYPLDGFPQKFS